MTTALFRPEAIAHQGQRLEGALILSQPLPQRLLASLLVVLTAAAVILLATNSYQRKVAVPGTLQPVAGLIELSVPQSGVISELLVEVDQRVEAGQALLVVSSEHVLESGENAEQELLLSLQQQGQGLLDKLAMAQAQAKVFEQDFTQRLQQTEQQIRQMESTEVRQQMLLELRLKQNQRGEQLRNQGLLAAADQETLQAQWLSQLQVAADVQTQLQGALATRDNLRQEQAKQRLRNQQEQQDLQAQLQQARQQQLQVRRDTRRVITAPVAGRISMLPTKAGMSVKPQQVLLGLWPAASPLQLELQVPSHAIGFIKPGQRVNLRLDAFPYQKFGVQHATVAQIGGSNERNEVSVFNGGQPYYRLIADLDKQSIMAYGKEQRLLPGMSVSAEIRVDQRTLLEWLLEPLYSLKGY